MSFEEHHAGVNGIKLEATATVQSNGSANGGAAGRLNSRPMIEAAANPGTTPWPSQPSEPSHGPKAAAVSGTALLLGRLSRARQRMIRNRRPISAGTTPTTEPSQPSRPSHDPAAAILSRATPDRLNTHDQSRGRLSRAPLLPLSRLWPSRHRGDRSRSRLSRAYHWEGGSARRAVP